MIIIIYYYNMACIYINNRNKRCNNNIINNCKYCLKHINKKLYIFEIIDIVGTNELYDMFDYIFNNNMYIEDSDVLDNSIANKKNIFVSVLNFIITKTNLQKYLVKYNININSTKKQVIQIIFNLFYKTYNLNLNLNKKNDIIKIQRLIKKKIKNRIVKYNTYKSENNEDPFTFDNVEDIPLNNRFSFKDTRGHIYIFNLIEFEYFIRNNGKWNPYTRDILDDNIINDINLLIKYNGLIKKQDLEIWQSPSQAYTEVSICMEKAGFYNNVIWFNKINYDICIMVIDTYKDLSINDREYFNSSLKLTRDNYIYPFCKELIRLFKKSDEHYILCCNFMKALALNLEDFYKNIPSWLSNITSPSNILDNTNSSFLYYYLLHNLAHIDNIENLITNEILNNNERDNEITRAVLNNTRRDNETTRAVLNNRQGDNEIIEAVLNNRQGDNEDLSFAYTLYISNIIL